MPNTPKTPEITSQKPLIPRPEVPADCPYKTMKWGAIKEAYADIRGQEAQIRSQVDKLWHASRDFRDIFLNECMLFLLTVDRQAFLSEYTGECLDNDAHTLIRKDGKPGFFEPHGMTYNHHALIGRVALEKFLEQRKEIESLLKR